MNIENLTIDNEKILEIVNSESGNCEWVLKIVDDGFSCCRAAVSDDGELILKEERHESDFLDAFRYILGFCHDDNLYDDFSEIVYSCKNRFYYIRNDNGDDEYASMYVGDYAFGYGNIEDDSDAVEMHADSLYSAIGCFCDLVKKNEL